MLFSHISASCLLCYTEKQSLNAEDVLDEETAEVVKSLEEWCNRVCEETGLKTFQAFSGFYQGTLPSLVLLLTEYGKTSSWTRDQIEEMAKRLLLGVALPVAVMHSRILQEVSESVFRHTPLSQRPNFKRSTMSKTKSVAKVSGRKRSHQDLAVSDRHPSEGSGSFHSTTTDDSEDGSMDALSNTLTIAMPSPLKDDPVPRTMTTPASSLSSTSIGLSAYFDKHAHLFSLLQCELNDFDRRQSSSHAVPSTLGAASRTDCVVGKLLLVTTKSPVPHFQSACDRWTNVEGPSAADRGDGWVDSMCETDVKVIQLALVASERQLTETVVQFYRDEGPHRARLLTVLCDPMYCHSAVVSHARFVVTRERWLQELRLTRGPGDKQIEPADGVLKHVVFIMHLPPGISNRMREFTLDFHAPWSYTFIDDLRTAEEIGGPPLTQLMKMSIYDLCRTGRVDLNRILLSSFQSALTQCQVSPARDLTAESGKVSYVKMIKELLGISTLFEYLRAAVLECLRQQAPPISRTNMQLHVQIACGDNSAGSSSSSTGDANVGGSLRQSLQLAVEGLVVQSLGWVLRYSDTNFNLPLLYLRINKASAGSHAMETASSSASASASCNSSAEDANDAESFVSTWLHVADKLQPPERVGELCPVLVAPALTRVRNENKLLFVHNNGLHGVFTCHFPFSEKLIAQMGDPQTRQEVEQAAASAMMGQNKSDLSLIMQCRSLSSMLDTMLGTQSEHSLAFEITEQVLHEDPSAYLHDYVAIKVHPSSDISFVEHVQVFQALVETLMIGAEADGSMAVKLTPAVVHVAHWALELRLYHALSAVSAIRGAQEMFRNDVCVDSSVEQMLLRGLSDVLQSSTGSSQAASGQRMREIDIALCLSFLRTLSASLDDVINLERTASRSSQLSSAMVVAGEEGKSDSSDVVTLSMWAHLMSVLQTDIEVLLLFVLEPYRDVEATASITNITLDQSTAEIIQLWWGLRAARVVINDLRDPRAGGGQGENARTAEWQLRIITAARSSRPLSHQSLLAFKTACIVPSVGIKSATTSRTLNLRSLSVQRAYICKFVATEGELLMRSGIATSATGAEAAARALGDTVSMPMSRPLLDAIATLTEMNFAAKQNYDNSEIRTADLALRRTAMTILIGQARMPGSKADAVLRHIFSAAATNPDDALMAAQLYVEYIEDNSIRTEVDSHAALLPDEMVQCVIQLTTGALADVPMEITSTRRLLGDHGTAVLTALAHAKCAIGGYCIKIAEHCNTYAEQNDPGILAPPAAIQTLLELVPDARVYLLAYLFRTKSPAFLLNYLRRRGLPLLPAGVKTIDPSTPLIQAVDPFSNVDGKDCYIEACKAVRALRFGEDKDVLQKWAKNNNVNSSNKARKLSVLLLATLTQVTVTGTSFNSSEAGERMMTFIRTSFGSRSTYPGSSASATGDGSKSFEVYSQMMEFLVHMRDNSSAGASMVAVATVATTKPEAKKAAGGRGKGKKAAAAEATATASSVAMEVVVDDSVPGEGHLANSSLRSIRGIFGERENVEAMLRLHACIVAMTKPDSWLAKLLTEPGLMKNHLLPSIIDDDTAMLMNFMGEDGTNQGGQLGWYQCSKGHIYSIGNCTMPNQTTTCPAEGCGETIGGTDHNLVKTSKRLGKGSEVDRSVRGYNLESTGSANGYDIGRSSKATVCVLRYLMHTVLLMATDLQAYRSSVATSSSSSSSSSSAVPSEHSVSQLLYPNAKEPVDVIRLQNDLTSRLRADWATLKELLVDMDDQDLAMGMHMVLFLFESTSDPKLKLKNYDMDPADRMDFEFRYYTYRYPPSFLTYFRSFCISFFLLSFLHVFFLPSHMKCMNLNLVAIILFLSVNHTGWRSILWTRYLLVIPAKF